jgi:D-ribose pyranose/furanose isomerase RbsD
MTFEQLQKKIIIAEKTKQEALQARESLTSLMHKMEKKYVHSFLNFEKETRCIFSHLSSFTLRLTKSLGPSQTVKSKHWHCFVLDTDF